MWSHVGDGESVSVGVGVVILGEGGVVLEEVDCWNGISIDLTHQLDATPSHQTHWNSHTKNSSWFWKYTGLELNSRVQKQFSIIPGCVTKILDVLTTPT